MFYAMVPSPLGQLMLAGAEGRLRVIGFPTGGKARGPEPGWRRADDLFADAARQIGEYFAGERRAFDLPLAPESTPFQAEVLAELRRIPYGETRTYGQIAWEMGRPGASRAVGAANGRNPLPIVIPCHRVVGRTGALTGFGGGLAAKRYLLELERRNAGARGQGRSDQARMRARRPRSQEGAGASETLDQRFPNPPLRSA